MKKRIKEKKKAWKKYTRTKTNGDRVIYAQKRNEAKEAVKQAKRESWESFGRKIEDNYISNQKQFWNIIKRLKGNRTQKIRSIKNAAGELQTETKHILQAWAEHYTSKFKGDRNAQIVAEGNNEQEEVDIITEEEIRMTLKKAKNKKAAREDGITAEMLKKGGPGIVQWLKQIFQKAWNTENIPDEWRRNIIVSLHKKGDSTNRDNYRVICLSRVLFKIY